MNGRRVLMVAMIAALAGCGGGDDKWTESRPKTAPAEGTVTYNGKPVEGATVVLAPEAAPGAQAPGASGVTGSDGSFSLLTFEPGDGAVPGRYQVSVTKQESQAAPAPSGSHEEAPPPPKHLLPKKYSDPKTSGLTVEIPAGGKTDIKIDLK